MDFQTARQSILNQTVDLQPEQQPFIHCLRQGTPPIPGQVTTLLLALRVVGEGLKQEPTLDRRLAHAFFVLTYESRSLYRQHQDAGQEWPPLLNEDLDRIAKAVRDILADDV
jgi:hypothetical protein